MKKLLVVLLLLVVVYVGVGLLFMPSTVEASTNAEINAPRAQVHQQLATLKTWPEWSAWSTEADAKAKFTFEGPETGVGSIWKWTSEGDLGTGTMKITKADPNEIGFELQFERMKPATGLLKLEEADGKTKVTWQFNADFGNAGLLVPRWMIGLGMFEKSLVKQFDDGLAKLKTRLEGGEKAGPADASMKKDGAKKDDKKGDKDK